MQNSRVVGPLLLALLLASCRLWCAVTDVYGDDTCGGRYPQRQYDASTDV